MPYKYITIMEVEANGCKKKKNKRHKLTTLQVRHATTYAMDDNNIS